MVPTSCELASGVCERAVPGRLGTPELYTKLSETLNSHVRSGELLFV